MPARHAFLPFVLLFTACAAPSPAETSWHLVWSDEFDRDGGPDPTKWDYEDGRIRNDELQARR